MLGVVFFQFKLNIITKKVLLIILVLIIFFLGIRTIIRNSNWKDGLTLYSHDELITPNSFDLENNLGVELFRAGRFNEAEAHFLASTKIAPSWWTNWNNLGVIVERKSKIEEAKIYYQKAIDNGQYYLAYQNLAKIYLYYDTPDMAKSFCEESLKKFPNNASLWTILAISEYKLKDQNKALLAAKNAYLLEPSQQNALIYSRLQQNLSLEDK
jgi:tetratricopeptide (TPR) repeat protein